jgi:hypothetical protein
LAAKLVEIAKRFKALQEAASVQAGDDPKIAALKADAQKAIEVGELAKADALLADVETEHLIAGAVAPPKRAPWEAAVKISCVGRISAISPLTQHRQAS